MFERFTDRARRVIVLAKEGACSLNHNYIGTEHILFALVAEGEGIAAKVLQSFDVTADEVSDKIVKVIGRGEVSPAPNLPFTPRAKKVTELALREALQLGHNYIGTEHLLLGIVREDEGLGARILFDFCTAQDVRKKILEMLGVTMGTEKRTQQPELHVWEVKTVDAVFAQMVVCRSAERAIEIVSEELLKNIGREPIPEIVNVKRLMKIDVVDS